MRIAVLGNGESFDCAPDMAHYDLIVALDGAANACAKTHITPQLIIGDMDSLQIDPLRYWPTVQLVTLPDQTATDFDKTLAHLAATQSPPYTVDGFWLTSSDRIDHTLNNLLHLAEHPELEWVYTAHDRIRYLPNTLQLNDPMGTRVSLLALPVPGTPNLVVDIEGCVWSGRGITLDQLQSGMSNRVSRPPVRITKNSGQGFVCVSREP